LSGEKSSGSSRDLEITSGRFGHWMSRLDESSFSINFLIQKYIHIAVCTRVLLPYLKCSVFTDCIVKTHKYSFVGEMKLFTHFCVGIVAVLSANFKSSTSTMVYVAGFFHLACMNNYRTLK